MFDATGTFNWGRMARITRYSFWQDWRKVALALGVFAGCTVLLGLLLGSLGFPTAALIVLYRLALAGGLIYTAGAFAEVHQKLQAPRFLMLPASTAEKLAARWLLTAIAYPLMITAAAMFLHQVTYLFHAIPGIHAEVNGVSVVLNAPRPWELFPEGRWSLALDYLIGQSIFFWGALRFPTNAFFKTLLCICGGAVLLLLTYLLLRELHVVANDTYDPLASAEEGRPHWTAAELFARAIKYGLCVLAPLLIFAAYRKLRKCEA
jgi:hypothetical protein